MITAATRGWTALRVVVFRRDRGCVAVQEAIFGTDVATDQCRDRMGFLIAWNDLFRLEWDHVKQALGLSVKAPNDEAHGVAVCPWHHRLSSQWRIDTAEHREKIRDYLRRLYPEVWNAAP